MNPQPLPPNVLHHFYAGGARIAAFRGLQVGDDHAPEEWLGAVTTTFGGRESGRGLSRLLDGTLLRDAVAADPDAWLGSAHTARFGADTGLLTKLLDAGQRLPVHFHPGRAFAREHLGLAHGKTEAWVIVDAEPGASVHVGFAEPVALETVRGWMRTQDSDAMLSAMRELPVASGDAIFVPAGTPHAIGAGILLVELQEPTDLSVLLEWDGFELTEDEGHLELGWDVVLDALDLTAFDDARIAGLVAPAGGERLLPPDADPYFRVERIRAGDALDPGFSVVVGLTGSGSVTTASAATPIERGSALVLPHAAGPATVTGDVTGLRCRPADPGSGEGRW